jgi:hypothetical protein
MNQFLSRLENIHKTVVDSETKSKQVPVITEPKKEDHPMWLQFLIRSLSSVPLIVAGIEAIHGEALRGAEKKQMAMDALGLSSFVASMIDPQHTAIITAASQLASQTIDGVKAVMNASKELPAPIQTGTISV